MTTFQNCRSIYIFNYLLKRHIDRAAVAHSQFKQCLIYVPSLSRERGTRTGLFVSGMRLFVSGMQPATRLVASNKNFCSLSCKALFAFAAIKSFDTFLAQYDEYIMVFINKIAYVVHDCVENWLLEENGKCN